MSSTEINSSTFDIIALNAFSDNYIWALTNKKADSTTVALVDPGDANICIKFLEQHQLILNTILITHHHADHTGGIKDLIAYCHHKQWPLTVYGPANEDIPLCDVKLTENDIVKLPLLGMDLQVIDLPGHTSGHIAYFYNGNNNDSVKPVLFCGDTLFSGGCGRLFEGSAEQMLNSLTKLANLPAKTQVYCAHEYTKANLTFALTVEPNNQALINYSHHVNELRAKKLSTIPSSIKIEKQINPFLRCHKASLQTSAQQFDMMTKATEQETFATIRRWKDQF